MKLSRMHSRTLKRSQLGFISMPLLFEESSSYTINRSLRFRSTASAYLSRTPTIASNRKTWTWSCWVKPSINWPNGAMLFSAENGSGNYTGILMGAGGGRIAVYNSRAAGAGAYAAPALRRDPSSHYHVMVSVDMTQAGAIEQRLKIYVNGELQTGLALEGGVTGDGGWIQNADTWVNGVNSHSVGRLSLFAGQSFFDGLLSEVHFVDGQALTPSSFGQIDPATEQWVAKKYLGTYGTNGFYLPFTDNASARSLCFNRRTNDYASFNGTATGVQISTAQSKWGTGSILVNGAYGSSLTMSASADYNLGAGVFALEIFVYDLGKSSPPATNALNYAISQGDNASNLMWGLSINSANRQLTWGFSTATVTVASPTVPTNQWHHIVVTRDGSNVERIFLNGVLVSQRTNTTNYGSASPLVTRLGSHFDSNYPGVYGVSANANVWNGYLQDAAIYPGYIPLAYQTSSTTVGATIFNVPASPISISPGNDAWNYSGFVVPGSGTNGSTSIPVFLPQNWTPNNISVTAGVTYDQMTDVPTGNAPIDGGNFCTWNPNDSRTNKPVNANLRAGHNAGEGTRGTFWASSGKWYCEFAFDTGTNGVTVGIGNASAALTSYPGSDVHAVGYSAGDGNKYNGGVATAYGATWGIGDIIGMAYDLDNGRIWWSKNGVWQGGGDPSTGANPAYTGLIGRYAPIFGINPSGTGSGCSANFGQRPYAYPIPTGFKRLHTGNLTTPPVPLPKRQFDVLTYSGNGSVKDVAVLGANPYVNRKSVVSTTARSLRFRRTAGAYLSRTPSVAGNRQRFTCSCWVKISSDADLNSFVSAGNASNEWGFLGIADRRLRVYDYVSAGLACDVTSVQVINDQSVWNHCVIVVDTTQAVAADRVKFYLNGRKVDAGTSTTYPAQNYQSHFNGTFGTHRVGGLFNGAVSAFLEGYLSRLHFIDGQALGPESFGQLDSLDEQWVPKDYTGTYGTNGFYLDFRDATSTTTLCYDYSGNNNNWTPTNISLTAGVTYDHMLDGPTNDVSGVQPVGNYCTLNPLDQGSGTSAFIKDGNLLLETGNVGYSGTRCTIATPTNGKWYWEVTQNVIAGGMIIGIASAATARPVVPGEDSTSYGYVSDGAKRINGANSAYGAAYTTNDVIGVALDLDAGTLVFYKNNVSQGVAFSGISGSFFPMLSDYSNSLSSSAHINFGQRPFSYTPPTGFNSLCESNLPTVNKTFWESGLAWLKGRSLVSNHVLTDFLRGPGLQLASNQTVAQTAVLQSTGAFFRGGLRVGNDATVNQNAASYVGQFWRRGGQPAANNAGAIPSTVSVNATAGISIATYPGTLSAAGNATVGHGLPTTPSLVISKSLNVTGLDGGLWNVQASVLGANKFLQMNSDAAVGDSVATGGGSRPLPTSSVFYSCYNSGSNVVGNNYVAYCFAEIPGFSRFGLYTGTGVVEGPYVETGFEPAWLIIKSVSVGGAGYNWIVYDSARSPSNAADDYLFPNLSDVESVNISSAVDFLSNGFKVRTAGNAWNQSGQTFLFIAFARVPFKYANAR